MASAELKERILTHTRYALGEIPDASERFVGAIHARFLEQIESGFSGHLAYELINEVQQALLIERSRIKAGLATSTAPAGH